MNRQKRTARNDDVRLQLGEPLPLPYKIDIGAHRPHLKEEEDDTAVETKPVNTNKPDPIPPIIGYRSTSSRPRIEPEVLEERATHPVPIPLRRVYKPRITSIRVTPPRHPAVRYRSREEEALLGSIDEKLANVKQLLSELADLDLRTLEQVETLLQDLLISDQTDRFHLETNNSFDIDDTALEALDESRSKSIIDELDRLQRLRESISGSSSWWNKSLEVAQRHYVVMGGVTLAVVCFLVFSLFLSELNYDYCYYFC